MSPNKLLILVYSIIRIFLKRYPEESLSKLYRIGNRIFRPSYSDLDGIPFAEAILFSHTQQPEKFQTMEEHTRVYSHYKTVQELLAIRNDSERLDADVFYKLKAVEPQKTPHACGHAAEFMVLDYARRFYRKKRDSASNRISETLGTYSKHSGYDDGVGIAPLSSILKAVGLFTQSKPATYGLSSYRYIDKDWPEDLNELAQYFAYLLFFFGPFCVTVQELNVFYAHAITITGVLQANKQQPAQIIFADPWEGEMLVEPFDQFAPMLRSAARNFHNNKGVCYHISVPNDAGFYRRFTLQYNNPMGTNQRENLIFN